MMNSFLNDYKFPLKTNCSGSIQRRISRRVSQPDKHNTLKVSEYSAKLYFYETKYLISAYNNSFHMISYLNYLNVENTHVENYRYQTFAYIYI